LITRWLAILAGLLMAWPACAEPFLLKLVHNKDVLAFTGEDVARTRLTLENLSKPAIEVRLTDTATGTFRAFTAQLIGQQVDVFVCDVLVITPVIQTPIESGQLILTGPALEDDKTLQTRLLERSCE
jgi:preprotein translocase subunit SecD